jgi:hypothetical protein
MHEHRRDYRFGYADVLQVDEFVGTQVEGSGRVGHVSHQHGFVHTRVNHLNDFGDGGIRTKVGRQWLFADHRAYRGFRELRRLGVEGRLRGGFTAGCSRGRHRVRRRFGDSGFVWELEKRGGGVYHGGLLLRTGSLSGAAKSKRKGDYHQP